MKGVLLGILLAGFVLACAGSHSGRLPPPAWEVRMAKIGLVNDLWVQIRDLRREAGMQVDPPDPLERQFRRQSVAVAKAACPDEQATAPTCTDICVLAEHICDNAETICKIADELGKDDPSQEKCTSAKASCREARQRCCNCNANPPAAMPTAEVLPPAAPAGNAAP